MEHNPLYSSYWDLFERVIALPHTNIADIGASDGGFVQAWHRTSADIHLFEPVPSSITVLKEKFGHEPRVCINGYGISDKPEVIRNASVMGTFTLGNQSLVGMEEASEYRDYRFDLHLRTLDSYVLNHPKLQFSFIKIDVDGYEPMVLRGARECLLRDRPPILFECSHLPALLGQDIWAMVKLLIADLGYVFASKDGRVILRDIDKVMKCWPWDTSFDVMLINTQNPLGLI